MGRATEQAAAIEAGRQAIDDPSCDFAFDDRDYGKPPEARGLGVTLKLRARR